MRQRSIEATCMRFDLEKNSGWRGVTIEFESPRGTLHIAQQRSEVIMPASIKELDGHELDTSISSIPGCVKVSQLDMHIYIDL